MSKNKLFQGIAGLGLFVLLLGFVPDVSAATHKLNLEVRTDSSDDPCGSLNRLGFDYRITNYDSSSVDRANLRIKMWFNTSSTLYFNGFWAGANGASASAHGPCGTGDRLANQQVILTFSSSTINGSGGTSSGKAMDVHRNWATPFDDNCDDYSRLTSTSYINSIYYVLEQYVGGEWVYVTEYTNSTTVDPNTGQYPCSASPIEAAKSANPMSACVGDAVTFCITATNTGGDAHTFDIWDTVPAGLTYSGCDNSCSQSGGVVSWTVTSLAASSSVTRCYWVTVDALPFYEFNRVMFAGLREEEYLYFAEPVLSGFGSAARGCEDCGLRN